MGSQAKMSADSTTASARYPARKHALDVLLERGIGGAHRIRSRGLGDGDAFFRNPCALVLAVHTVPRGGCEDAQDRLDGFHKPVRTERQHGAGIDQGTEGVAGARPFPADSLLGPSRVINAVIRLHGGNHAEFREARDV